MSKDFIAHSSLVDLEKNKNIPVQLYQDHVNGVVKNILRELSRCKKHINKKIFKIMRKSLIIAGLYHDLGKLDKQAQSCLHGETDIKMINHVDAGVAFLLSEYKRKNDDTYLVAAYLILGHHIGFCNFNRVFETTRDMLKTILPLSSFRDYKSLEKYSMGNDTVKNHVNKNLTEYIKIHNKLIKRRINFKKTNNKDARVIITNPLILKICLGFLVNADHEDTSNNYGEIYVIKTKKLNPEHHYRKLLNAVSNIECEYKKGNIKCSKARFKIRQDVFNASNDREFTESFYLVDGAVGVGKTISIMKLSLELAIKFKMNYLTFILPYIALIDQSAEEYKRILFDNENDAKYNLSTVHSVFKATNMFHRKYTKGFNSPINLTTSVNFFNIISNNHTSVFKNIIKFIGNVIIIDEYHTIASYEFWPTILKIMTDFVKYFSCKFVFSSGTPIRFWEIDRIQSISNFDFNVETIIPEKTYDKMIQMENKRVKITSSIEKEWNFNQLATRILRKNKSTFVILNTRKKAVAFSNIMRNKTKRKVFLRFSGLAPCHRKEQFDLVKKSMANNEPVIVIATQGADIGLDISFVYGFKESSSYDSVAQMKGRINRGCEYKNSSLHVFKLCKCPNGDNLIFHNNPGFKSQCAIFENEKELHKTMSPEYSTYMAEQEIEGKNKDLWDEMDYLASLWNQKRFEEFSEKFNLINMPMIHVLINNDIYEKIKKNEYVPYADIQNNIVNVICSNNNMDLLQNHLISISDDESIDETIDENTDGTKKKITYDNNLYFWNGIYDRNNFGIFIDPIFQLVPSHLIVA